VLTAAEQILRAKAQAALERLTLAKSRGEPLELAAAHLQAAHVQGALDATGACGDAEGAGLADALALRAQPMSAPRRRRPA
jgi:hypothetical protein